MSSPSGSSTTRQRSPLASTISQLRKAALRPALSPSKSSSRSEQNPARRLTCSGVNAVPKGQVEAALSIGLTDGQVMRKIVLPQAIRYVIPSLISQLVVVVKDTSVAYVVSFPDILQNGRVLISNYDALVSVYFVVAVIYVLINYAINQASIYVARRSGTKIIARTEENPV